MLLFHTHSQVQRILAQCYAKHRYLLNAFLFNSEMHQALLGIKGLITIML